MSKVLIGFIFFTAGTIVTLFLTHNFVVSSKVEASHVLLKTTVDQRNEFLRTGAQEIIDQCLESGIIRFIDINGNEVLIDCKEEAVTPENEEAVRSIKFKIKN